MPTVAASPHRHLHELLAQRVDQWRADGYPSPEAPAIGEVLEWARGEGNGNLRFLRAAQVRALETYWYLRLVERTPDILSLYRKLFGSGRDLRLALGLTADGLRDLAEDIGLDALLERVKSDDQLVRDFRLEALRETLTLSYPSYILALAMGAGKTILVGAIIATEFAMALEYPDGPFVQNALVFA
ncbi:MAG: DEAD/DEAH box helicase family protein, partial [Gemmatimonadaceae bacterium]